MAPTAPASDSVLERPMWGRVRYFGGWGLFAAALLTTVAVLLSDAPSGGLAGATFLTEYGARPLRGALLVALCCPLVGAWGGALVPLARRGAAGGLLLGVLGLAPLLLLRAAVSGWGWEDAPAFAGLVVGAATLGYAVHRQFAALPAGRAEAKDGTPPGPAT